MAAQAATAGPGSVVLQGDAFQRVMLRMAGEIAERNRGSRGLLLAGIQRGGAPLARRLGRLVSDILGVPVETGTLDVTMYRDDLDWRRLPELRATELPADLDGRVVVLTDDVIFRGRTIRAALDALHALGRPGVVQLAVLADRGHRTLPIRPDFTGLELPTLLGERVVVRFAETHGRDEVLLLDTAA